MYNWFIATDDPTVLGIEDVEFEEVDLEFDVLFPDIEAQQSGDTVESHENYPVNN